MTDRRINVLYFSNQPERGGVEEHMLQLLRGLDRKCFRPRLVCHPELLGKLRRDLPDDVPAVPLYFERIHQFFAAARFARILRERQVEILHSHLFRASMVASPIGWLCRVPVILETPHVREFWRSGWFRGHYVVDRIAGRSVSHYIAVSESNARYLADTKGLPAHKIRVIQNGCDLSRFQTGHRPPAELKRSLGFAEKDPVVVVLARLELQKGHCVLIDAFRIVREAFPAVRLVCVGEGSLRSELEAQVRQRGLEDSVRFVGYQSNTPDWLALADMVALPSFFEGLPLVAIESLATGRTMVATAVDGTPEVVIHEKNGLTVAPGDPVALANALCRMLGEPGLRERLAQEGRRWVVENFSERRFIERTEQFYLQAWEQHLMKRKNQLPDSVSSAAHAASQHPSSV